MEFHNVKLLPRGLSEIIAQLVPYDIYPDTKVIAYSRKWMGPNGGSLGYAGYDRLTFSFHIGLYPTMCCSNGGRGHGYPGTFSFQLWMGMLRTAIHEIGHLATRELYYGMPHDDEHNYKAHSYVESLADGWADYAMARILRADPRLGQPPGALTGYPGILAYQMRSNGGKPWDGFNPHRMAEWRGLRCGGQVTSGDVAFYAMGRLSGSIFDLDYKSSANLRRVVRRLVHRAAKELGIERYFVNKNGRRYLMFNAGEAEAVYEWLVDNRGRLVDAYRMLKLQQEVPKHWKWELTDSSWELVGIDTPVKVPPEQMRLPLAINIK
ncbi:hypothetical protein ES703_45374 [subsurface metagenome]